MLKGIVRISQVNCILDNHLYSMNSKKDATDSKAAARVEWLLFCQANVARQKEELHEAALRKRRRQAFETLTQLRFEAEQEKNGRRSKKQKISSDNLVCKNKPCTI